MIADVASWALLVLGSFFCVVGGIGLHRFPDYFTRTHAAGVTDTLGAGLVMLGLIIQAGFSLIAVKLVLIYGFLLLTSATTGHALMKAAFAAGLKPQLADEEGGDAA